MVCGVCGEQWRAVCMRAGECRVVIGEMLHTTDEHRRRRWRPLLVDCLSPSSVPPSPLASAGRETTHGGPRRRPQLLPLLIAGPIMAVIGRCRLSAMGRSGQRVICEQG